LGAHCVAEQSIDLFPNHEYSFYPKVFFFVFSHETCYRITSGVVNYNKMTNIASSLIRVFFALALFCPLVFGDRWIVTVSNATALESTKNELRQRDAKVRLAALSAKANKGANGKRTDGSTFGSPTFKTDFSLDDGGAGFIVQDVSQDALNALKSLPGVEIEKDQKVRACTTPITQVNPPSVGIDRIDQRGRPLSASFTYLPDGGSDIDVYVLDSGVLKEHVEFGGRASIVQTYIGSLADAKDENGHGTYIASIVGGATVGVARNVRILSVKVLDRSGDGSLTDIIAAVKWVIAEVAKTRRRSILLIPLSTKFSSTLNRIVNSAARRMVVVVPSGNENIDTRRSSPGSASRAITVGSINPITDQRSPFSNFGSLVDIHAPGEVIFGAFSRNSTSYITLGGTSAAAAHVAGVAAAFWSANPRLRSTRVVSSIIKLSTKNVVRSLPRSTRNRLVYYRP
jgi:subtilisin family serine protease